MGDCAFVFATTARARELTKPVVSPERAMQMAARRCAAGEPVAVLFGPERAGLENDDIARANAIVSVPVNPDFASLNLAQCVLLTAYEWRRQGGEITHETVEMAGTDWASGDRDREAGASITRSGWTRPGSSFPPDKAASMKVNLRNLWSPDAR